MTCAYWPLLPGHLVPAEKTPDPSRGCAVPPNATRPEAIPMHGGSGRPRPRPLLPLAAAPSAALARWPRPARNTGEPAPIPGSVRPSLPPSQRDVPAPRVLARAALLQSYDNRRQVATDPKFPVGREEMSDSGATSFSRMSLRPLGPPSSYGDMTWGQRPAFTSITSVTLVTESRSTETSPRPT